MKRAVLFASAISLALPACAGKLIETGWDHVNPERMRQNLEVIEQAPFQGLVIEFSGPGGRPQYRYAHSAEVWDESAIPSITPTCRRSGPPNLATVSCRSMPTRAAWTVR